LNQVDKQCIRFPQAFQLFGDFGHCSFP